jgi:hypothetical protein
MIYILKYVPDDANTRDTRKAHYEIVAWEPKTEDSAFINSAKPGEKDRPIIESVATNIRALITYINELGNPYLNVYLPHLSTPVDVRDIQAQEKVREESRLQFEAGSLGR